MIRFLDNVNTPIIGELKAQLACAQTVSIAVAFVRNSGVGLLLPAFERNLNAGGSIRLLFGSEMGITEPNAVARLRNAGVELRYYNGALTFHPKGYIFSTGEKWTAIVGSSNITGSGLSSGIEWNILIEDRNAEVQPVVEEFERLWMAPQSSVVTNELIAALPSIKAGSEIEDFVAREDRVYLAELSTERKDLLGSSRNYVVTRRPDGNKTWNFQIYEGQIKQYIKKGPFNLVVVCNYETESEHVFCIPYSFLKDNILPKAQREKNGRYLFEVNKQTFRFNWRRSIDMDGTSFLLPN